MFFDKDGAFERAARRSALGSTFAHLALYSFLLLNADQHFRKEVTLQLLPGLTIFAHANGAMQAKFAEPTRRVSLQMFDVGIVTESS